jgi:polysaccharide deacetylase family protein (PEP-CTERM system associated)
VKANFFVVGLLARSRPHLVKEIARRGHEVASHSYMHRLIPRMTPAEFAEDVALSKKVLEDLVGRAVVGFRAPEFSVQRLDHPCFTALKECGFEYDSSVFPASGLRYSIEHASRQPFDLVTSAGTLRELPLGTVQVGSWRLPLAGGGHFRVLPKTLVTWAARRAEAAGESMVFYFHPYEFSRGWLYPEGGFSKNRAAARMIAIHNIATRRIEGSLRAVAKHLRFVTLRELARA